MKNLTLVLACFCSTAFAQADPTQPPVKLPTFVGGGVSCNQLATPYCTPWMTAVYPASSGLGVYLSTTADIRPVQQVDPGTGRTYWAFTTSIRQGVHKILFTSGAFSALLGGDAGGAFSQAAPAGIGVSFTGSITATAVWQFRPKFGLVIPLRAIWVNGGWNVVPQIGILFKP
jgi:hypothetical protein